MNKPSTGAAPAANSAVDGRAHLGSGPADPLAQRALPRLGLLREMTDEAVMAQVFAHGRVTRADLAALTGISKPTTWQSVRRLEDAGLLTAAGSNETGRRGRVATFYELPPGNGWVFAVQVDQSGLHLRSVDLMGRVILEQHDPPGPPGDSAALIGTLREALHRANAAGRDHGPVRGGVISVANPVDPATHHIIAMPDSPFPEGQASLDEGLSDLIDAPVIIDNDVNLAAAAERASGVAATADNFAYLYVGAGMGMGLYVAGRPVRGAHGLAGEVGELPVASHLHIATDAPPPTDSPAVPRAGATPEPTTETTRTMSGKRSEEIGHSPSLARALHQSGFGADGRPSLRVDEIVRLLDSGGELPDSILTIAGVIAQAIAATCAIIDPELVVLGGPVGVHPTLLAPVREAVARIWPGPVRIELSTIGDRPALRGATGLALTRGRTALLASVGAHSST